MTRYALIISTEDDGRELAEELATAAKNGEGLAIRTGGGSFTVEADRVQSGYPARTLDADAVDAIALVLGTSPEWNADQLQTIADIIGEVRDHPGDADPVDYVEDFTATWGVDPEESSYLRRYLSGDFHDAKEERTRPARTCRHCGEVFETTAALDADGHCAECAADPVVRFPHEWSPSGARCTRTGCDVAGTGDADNDGPCTAHPDYTQTWTFVGHWENDKIVVEHVVEGEVKDERIDTGYWEEGLFAASGSGRTMAEAEAAVREEYESQYRTCEECKVYGGEHKPLCATGMAS